jgi:hypothetical protein
MKLSITTVLSMSLVAALLSLLAILALSAMTVVPRSNALRFRDAAMAVESVLFLVWLGVSLWVWRRQRVEASEPVAVWKKRLLLAVSVTYCLVTLLGIMG